MPIENKKRNLVKGYPQIIIGIPKGKTQKVKRKSNES